MEEIPDFLVVVRPESVLSRYFRTGLERTELRQTDRKVQRLIITRHNIVGVEKVHIVTHVCSLMSDRF